MSNFSSSQHRISFYKLLTPGDKTLLGILIIATILSFIFLGLPLKGESGTSVEIRGDNNFLEQWSLRGKHRIIVPGSLGDTFIDIENGSVHVHSSPCPAKTCIKMGKKSRSGEIIVCVPNKVIIIIHGGKNELDGITQ